MRGPSWLAEFISSSSGALIIASSTWVDAIGTKCNKLFSLFRTLGRKRISAKNNNENLQKTRWKGSLPKESPAPTAKLKPSVLIKRQEPVKLRGKSYPRLEIIPCLGHLRSSVSEFKSMKWYITRYKKLKTNPEKTMKPRVSHYRTPPRGRCQCTFSLQVGLGVLEPIVWLALEPIEWPEPTLQQLEGLSAIVKT